MIIVIGSVVIKTEHLDKAIALSQTHVSRSRLEAGCLSHEVTQDASDRNRLLFLERWDTMEDLEQHFQVPESSEFVAEISKIASSAPDMQLYECAEIKRH